MSFGSKLKMCRVALGLSQQQLADLVGATKQIVSLYEKDDRIPKVTTAAKYAEAVNVPLKYLITDSIHLNLWEHDSLLEDYWRATASDKLKIVTYRGIDPRIARDYEQVSSLAQLVRDGVSIDPTHLSDAKKAFYLFAESLTDEQTEFSLRILKAALNENE